MPSKKTSEYLPAVIVYDEFGQAFSRRSLDAVVRIGDHTPLSAIVRRLKALGALKAAVRTAHLRQNERHWPARLTIERRSDGRELVILDRYEG